MRPLLRPPLEQHHQFVVHSVLSMAHYLSHVELSVILIVDTGGEEDATNLATLIGVAASSGVETCGLM